MRGQLAAELGPHGIRVVTLRTGGVPESLADAVEGREAIIEDTIVSQTMLGRAATPARSMTGATANVSCDALVDWAAVFFVDSRVNDTGAGLNGSSDEPLHGQDR